MNRQQMTLAVELATRHGFSFEEALAHLEYSHDPHTRYRFETAGRPIRYERVLTKSRDFDASPMTNDGDYQGEGLEPGRAAGPHGAQARPDADDGLPIETVANDPDLGRRLAGQGRDEETVMRVRVYAGNRPLGDVVLTRDRGVQVEADAHEGQALRRLLDAHAVTDVEGLRSLPDKIGQRGGLRAVIVEGDDQTDGPAGFDTMDADEPMTDAGFDQDDEMDRDMADGPDDQMDEDEEEVEEEPVRFARGGIVHYRRGERIVFTDPLL